MLVLRRENSNRGTGGWVGLSRCDEYGAKTRSRTIVAEAEATAESFVASPTEWACFGMSFKVVNVGSCFSISFVVRYRGEF